MKNILKIRLIIHCKNYKDYKRLFETIRQKSRINYYNEQISKYKNDSKKTWTIMKEIIGKSKIRQDNFPQKIKLEDKEISTKQHIAEEFNNFFVNIGPNLARKIPQSSHDFISYVEKETNILTTQDSVSESEIKKAFNQVKINKSPGFDDISINVVKNCFNELLKPLQYIFNRSIQTGNIPR